MVPFLLFSLSACEPYRIEYRERPAFAYSATDRELPEEEILPDGTRVIYRKQEARSELEKKSERGEDGEAFKAREETEDGRVVLRAVLPEHVLANTLICIQNEEYDVIWNQLLAEQTRQAYLDQKMGEREFTDFFIKHRHDLAATTNRMLLGLPRHEVVSDNVGAGQIRLRFVPQVGMHFKFRTVVVGSEQDGLKLVRIQ